MQPRTEGSVPPSWSDGDTAPEGSGNSPVWGRRRAGYPTGNRSRALLTAVDGFMPAVVRADTSTVVITASVLDVAGFLRRPANIRRYLTGVLPGTAAPDHQSELLRGRWEFKADPSGRRFHWWLLTPYRAEGSLDVYGDCNVSQVQLTVQVTPSEVPGTVVHEVARAVLHGLRRCIETDVRPPDDYASQRRRTRSSRPTRSMCAFDANSTGLPVPNPR